VVLTCTREPPLHVKGVRREWVPGYTAFEKSYARGRDGKIPVSEEQGEREEDEPSETGAFFEVPPGSAGSMSPVSF
jgi:hypothetical protein